MKVEFTTTIDDYVAFNRFAWRKSRSLRAVYIIGWFFLPILFSIIALGTMRQSLVHATIFAVPALLWLAAFPYVYRAQTNRQIRSFATRMGAPRTPVKSRLVPSNESITSIADSVTTTAKWADIKSVELDGDYTFVFLTAVSALIIPRHGFDSEDEYEEVREFALRQVRERVLLIR